MSLLPITRSPPCVRIVREDAVFLVIHRAHGWLHTNLAAAFQEAEELAAGHGCDVVPRIVRGRHE